MFVMKLNSIQPFAAALAVVVFVGSKVGWVGAVGGRVATQFGCGVNRKMGTQAWVKGVKYRVVWPRIRCCVVASLCC